MKNYIGKLTFWKCLAGIILAAGAYATFVRFTSGLGRSTNLNDMYPWGLWIGFDVMCGVGLAAGGFTIAALVHIFNVKRFEPILRPTILTAFLGYLLVIVGLMFDLGRPMMIWHAIIMWNPHSVMFEVAWCVMLYTTVLALEFAPVVLEKFKMSKTLRILRRVSIPIVILGVLLSTLHQSSLGSLFLIVPDKLYGLWYTPYLPIFFFVSALAAGCAMVIFESTLSARVFHRGLELKILDEIGRIAVVLLGVCLVMRVMDGYYRDISTLLFVPRMETYLYWFEMLVGVIAPIILLSQARIRKSKNGLFVCAVMIIIGFITDRLNIALTGMQASAGMSYFPSWMETSITLAIVTFGFVAFSLAAKYLPVYEQEEHAAAASLPEAWVEDLALISEKP
ncbi:MAG: Ni/Fe-hydrogenase cytochrome b subunit [Acidobacteriia bacterium]|nr:Ni/Fe-hydrogenase cytochrome b subunit [Terriglobia bacterium]